ncbi:MAG: hypothetical protein IPH82_02510 [Chloroflexi bacterium]|nr:hypothetical protein [Chloroflexota bacterium]
MASTKPFSVSGHTAASLHMFSFTGHVFGNIGRQVDDAVKRTVLGVGQPQFDDDTHGRAGGEPGGREAHLAIFADGGGHRVGQLVALGGAEAGVGEYCT